MRNGSGYGKAFRIFDPRVQDAITLFNCENENASAFVPSFNGRTAAYQAVANAIKSDSYRIADPILGQRLASDNRLFRLLQSCAVVGCGSASCILKANILQIRIVVGEFTYSFDWSVIAGRVSLIAISIHKTGLSMYMPHQTNRTLMFGLEAA